MIIALNASTIIASTQVIKNINKIIFFDKYTHVRIRTYHSLLLVCTTTTKTLNIDVNISINADRTTATLHTITTTHIVIQKKLSKNHVHTFYIHVYVVHTQHTQFYLYRHITFYKTSSHINLITTTAILIMKTIIFTLWLGIVLFVVYVTDCRLISEVNFIL